MPRNLGRILKEGVIGGLVAYAAVVVVFALLNVLEGRSVFYTAAAMASLILHGADAASQLAVEAGPVLVYNGVHLVGNIAVGFLAATLIFETERHRSFWYFTFTVWIAAIMYSITTFGVFGVEIGEVIDWTTVVVGTAVWIAAMTAYFWRVHKGIMGRIRESVETETVRGEEAGDLKP